MRTVQLWALRSGYRYVRIADADFLGAVPAWFRDKSPDIVQPVTDLARVEVAIRCLDAGAEAVSWVDGDVLVFDENCFVLPDRTPIAFTREVWLDLKGPKGRPYCLERVNNSVFVATDRSFLEHYRDMCLRIARACNGPLAKSIVGTQYLTALHRKRPLTLVRNVGNFSPHVVRAVIQAEQAVLDSYRACVGEPLFAANLCASYENTDYFGTLNLTADYERLVSLLLDSHGAVLR
jgi:hypothetical protein